MTDYFDKKLAVQDAITSEFERLSLHQCRQVLELARKLATTGKFEKSHCLICGKFVYKTRGPKPKTCGDKCRQQLFRNNRRDRKQAELVRDDAGMWLANALANPLPGTLRLVFHTVAWQYFPETTRALAEIALKKATSVASAEAPLARLSMEDADGKAAAVTLTTWPGGQERQIARADFHGRWIDWQAE